MKGFAMGNFEKDDAVKLANSIISRFKSVCSSKELFLSQRKQKRCLKLPISRCLYTEKGPNSANENSAIAVTYQVGICSLVRKHL